MAQRTFLFRTELWALIEHILKNDIRAIEPEIALDAPLGYRYPLAEQVMEINTARVMKDLELLVRIGIMRKEVSSFRIACPDCKQSTLRMHQICPDCKQQTIHKTILVECINCGHIQEMGESKNCSECKNSLVRNQEDYLRYEGFHCINCNAAVKGPILSTNCLFCGSTQGFTDTIQIPLYSYFLNLDEKPRLYRLLGSRPILAKEKPSRRRKVLSNRITIRLLRMLQKNSRRSYRDIGRRLGVSEATIRARVRKLTKLGMIKQFTAILDPQKIGLKYISLITVKGTPDKLEQIKTQLRNREEVKAIFEATGALELTLLIYFLNKSHMQEFVQEIGRFSGIEISSVSSNLNVAKYDFSIDLDKLTEAEI